MNTLTGYLVRDSSDEIWVSSLLLLIIDYTMILKSVCIHFHELKKNFKQKISTEKMGKLTF